MEETVRLEGFSESLRDRRSYCVASTPAQGKQFITSKLGVLDTEVAHRGRKVLVFQGTSPPPKWLRQIGWDAMFYARDVQDLKLAVTYIQHTSRPTRVVWAGTGDATPAPSIMALLAKMDGVTLLGLGSSAPIHPEWQAIFWPSDALQNSVEGAVQGRMGAAGVTGLRSILKELQGSQVGLVWSSIGESDKRGSLYWYDPTEAGEGGGQIDLDEAATILTEVAAFLRK
jgi:hypothetical protein